MGASAGESISHLGPLILQHVQLHPRRRRRHCAGLHSMAAAVASPVWQQYTRSRQREKTERNELLQRLHTLQALLHAGGIEMIGKLVDSEHGILPGEGKRHWLLKLRGKDFTGWPHRKVEVDFKRLQMGRDSDTHLASLSRPRRHQQYPPLQEWLVIRKRVKSVALGQRRDKDCCCAPMDAKKPPMRMQLKETQQQILSVFSGARRRRLGLLSMAWAAARTKMLLCFFKPVVSIM